ncbi:MAG: dihydrolipoyl dehydrogenase [bacterium]
MAPKNDFTQVAVIGAGPGGYAAAFRAADLGLQVALIDLEANPGGVCSFRGCIPSKALLHVAKILSETREAAEIGLEFAPPRIDLSKIRQWKEKVVSQLTQGAGGLGKMRKVNFIQGRASFIDSKTLAVQPNGAGNQNRLSFDYAIVATGSRPFIPPDLSVESDRLWNSTSALELKEIPESLLVVGGGYIGLELGTVYAALGSRVSVVEMTEGLLPGVDRDLVRILQKRVEKRFDSLRFNMRVSRMREAKGGLQVSFEEGGKTTEESFEKVLVAVGRKPNSSGLGLSNTSVEADAKGFLRVDAERRTSVPHIFAIGDVAGEPMLAHKATHEGITAAEVIAGGKAVFEPKAIPAVVFTDPEIAWCGLTETRARELGTEVNVSRFPWGASGRAITLNRNDGSTKILSDPDTDRVLGVGIVGSGAGDLISEGVLAMELGATSADLCMTIHPHPTLSETLMESAEGIHGMSLHFYKPKK